MPKDAKKAPTPLEKACASTLSIVPWACYPLGVTQRIILYDGLCGFCDKTILFVLERDHESRFHFASIQSDIGAELLAEAGLKPDLSSLRLIIKDQHQRAIALERSRAVAAILKELPGAWSWAGTLLGTIPKSIADLGYNTFARFRYKLFGKLDACRVPNPDERERFLA